MEIALNEYNRTGDGTLMERYRRGIDIIEEAKLSLNEKLNKIRKIVFVE